MAHKRLSSNQRDWQAKQEDLLIAIDQLEQITEVMGDVLGRVKRQIQALEEPHIAPKISHKKSKTESHTKKKRSFVH